MISSMIFDEKWRKEQFQWKMNLIFLEEVGNSVNVNHFSCIRGIDLIDLSHLTLINGLCWHCCHCWLPLAIVEIVELDSIQLTWMRFNQRHLIELNWINCMRRRRRRIGKIWNELSGGGRVLMTWEDLGCCDPNQNAGSVN